MKIRRSYMMTDEGIDILDELSGCLGLSRSKVIEEAIRRFYIQQLGAGEPGRDSTA